MQRPLKFILNSGAAVLVVSVSALAQTPPQPSHQAPALIARYSWDAVFRCCVIADSAASALENAHHINGSPQLTASFQHDPRRTDHV
jgi:hypothetical protein